MEDFKKFTMCNETSTSASDSTLPTPKQEESPIQEEKGVGLVSGVESGQTQHCGTCGSYMVQIRGKYPNTEKRRVCPTCTYERLEQINEISSENYGKAYKTNKEGDT